MTEHQGDVIISLLSLFMGLFLLHSIMTWAYLHTKEKNEK
jgi:hypothetical protein